jgi:hypothetical protein
MANYFQITRPDGLGTLKLDSQGRSQVQYTVKNVGAVRIEGRAVLVSSPPNAGPVEKGWVKIDGVAQRVFEVGDTQTFTVKIAVPLTLKPPPAAGDYTFHLDVVNAAVPDAGDAGQEACFTVQQAAKPAGKSFPWWIAVVAVVALLAIGGTLWYVLSPKNVTVPDLSKQTQSEANDALTKAGLSLGNVSHKEAAAEDKDKVVDQSPAANASVASKSTVNITLGTEKVVIPKPREREAH